MPALLVAAVASTLGGVPSHPANAQEAATRIVHKPDAAAREAGDLPYLLYLPAGYEESSADWPLLVFLHGGRGLGVDPARILKYPIPKMIERGEEVPFIVLAPQCPEGSTWTEVDGLMGSIDQIIDAHRVDRGRVYLTGQSYGGEGVWYAASRHPGRFAAIAPISGAADPAWAERLTETPAWVFHGALDRTVPVRHSDRMVAALEKRGGTVRYSRFGDRGHEPPTDEELAELFAWLLEHRLSTH